MQAQREACHDTTFLQSERTCVSVYGQRKNAVEIVHGVVLQGEGPSAYALVCSFARNWPQKARVLWKFAPNLQKFPLDTRVAAEALCWATLCASPDRNPPLILAGMSYGANKHINRLLCLRAMMLQLRRRHGTICPLDVGSASSSVSMAC